MSVKSISMCLIIIMAFLIAGCDDDRSGNSSGVPEPVPGDATRILLTVYPVGTEEEPQEITIRSEGDVYIDLGDSILATYYCIYAEADNYYTEIYNCTKGEIITVDLDSAAGPLLTMTGTIIAKQSFWSDCYFANQTMTLHVQYNKTKTVTTDNQGRYGIGPLPLGDYILEFSVQGEPIVLNLENSNAMDYQDLSFLEPTQVDAPNIYLYPETESDISVALDFPNGGYVKLSDPPYNNGWNVSVAPEGLIDGEYDYLFYKAIFPTQPHTNEGWLLTRANLEAEFRTILAEQGFIGREIDDFVEYWVPLFNDAPYYGVYPQDVESFVELNISPQPENTLRVFLLVLPYEQPVTIPVPREYDHFNRDGFTVAEWGIFAPFLDGEH